MGNRTMFERNIISGNDGNGVIIESDPYTSDGADENIVAGNYIGTDITGIGTLGNGESGVLFGYTRSAANAPDPVPPRGNVIGGCFQPRAT